MSERLTGAVNEVSRIDGEMVELSLLLPQWQVEAIETAAHCRGLTAGHLLRRVINTYLSASSNQR